MNLFISSNASICSTVAFPPFGNSDHVLISVFINVPINSKRDAPFHHIAYDYSSVNWASLGDHLRDAPWKDIFKLSVSAAGGKFCERVLVGVDVYISNRKYHVKPHFQQLVLL